MFFFSNEIFILHIININYEVFLLFIHAFCSVYSVSCLGTADLEGTDIKVLCTGLGSRSLFFFFFFFLKLESESAFFLLKLESESAFFGLKMESESAFFWVKDGVGVCFFLG